MSKQAQDWTDAQLRAEFQNPWLQYFELEAKAADWAVSDILAIASRETRIRNIIGDKGNGYGIMQIDKRYHKSFISSGIWKSPRANIAKGISILNEWRTWLRKHSDTTFKGVHIPALSEDWIRRISIACYNGGYKPAIEFAIHGNPDLATTGHDYSADVIARAKVFENLLANRKGPVDGEPS